MTMSPQPRTPFRFAAVAALGLALGVAACGSGTTHPASADVTPELRCTTSTDGSIHARGEVTNHSSEASFYAVDVSIRVDGRTIATHTATIESLDAGTHRRFEVAEPDAPMGDVTCEVASVTRLRA
jgi:hypothetical protein